MDLEHEVENYIKEKSLLKPGEICLLACSGGADSLALLFLLEALQEKISFDLEVLHVEHGIRGEESQRDAAFVEALCRSHAIPFSKAAVDVPAFAKEKGLGLEEAARILRYQALYKRAEQLALGGRQVKLAVAHHLEDHVETFLFQMLRGSGIAGLCGLHVKQGTKLEKVTMIRPLLFAEKEQILAYLQEKDQTYCMDSTNAEDSYSRNRLRHQVLPVLETINRQAFSHIQQATDSLARIADYMDQEANRLWPTLVKDQGEDFLRLDLQRLSQLHPAMQEKICYQALRCVAGNYKDLSKVHVEEILGLTEKQSGREYSLPQGIFARRDFDTIYIGRKSYFFSQISVSKVSLIDLESKENRTMVLPINDKFELKLSLYPKRDQSLEFEKNSYTKKFDYDKMKKGFVVRNRQAGDWIALDLAGHKKKLQNLFTDEKIPAMQRDTILLLAQEEQILWVVGGRMNPCFYVTEETEQILEVTCQKRE